MSTTGIKFTPMTFQIDTATNCNNLSYDTLINLMPNMKLTKSPNTLHPYGDALPLKPLWQVDLLCKWNKTFEKLTYQILSRDTTMIKPRCPSLWITVRNWASSKSQHTKYSHYLRQKRTHQERKFLPKDPLFHKQVLSQKASSPKPAKH